jgi:predicted phage baseplate assembly protein
MALPSPNLDDRRFQDLVDDAKRMVQRRCPEWTDHNVSDPGVTLIETFAFMTDQLLYRLNRVPDRLHVKFLDLIGLRILPPTAARADVTFWLSSAALNTMTIPVGTQVGTVRSETVESIVYSTNAPVTVIPCALQSLRTKAVDDEGPSVECTHMLTNRTPFALFAEQPKPEDQMLIGLTTAVPNCALQLDFTGSVQGLGVNPKRPPLVWEAWTGTGWTECEVSTDETGGLNRSGPIVLHVPPTHEASVIDGERAAWLRARITEPDEGQPPYSASPTVEAFTACTIGVTGEAIHAEVVEHEVLGHSEGVPGQVFPLLSRPVLAGVGDPVVEVSSDDGWTEWQPVDDFAASGADDRHFILDAFAGEVLFGPVVRQPDGTVRHHGAVPDKGAVLRIRQYAIGGGVRGNVGVGGISTLKSSIPFVARVANRHSGHGGIDGETLEEAKSRGPLLMRTRSRAVTAEDYEVLSRQAVPEAARVRCITAGEGGVQAGAVKVLVVPAAAVDNGRIRFVDLVPPENLLTRLADRLDEVRLIGTQVLVEPPRYRGVTVVARLIARPRVHVGRVREDALDALYHFINPLAGGGPDGTGWPFGRAVRTGDVYTVLQRIRGVESVEDVRLFTANPVTGERGEEKTRIDLDANSLVFSFEHQVRVEEH